MKVAVVIEKADPAAGGAERSISELWAALREAGIDADLVAASGRPGPGVHILHKGSRKICFKKFKQLCRDFFAQNPYDIIHSVLPLDFADIYQPRHGTYVENIARNCQAYEWQWQKQFKRLSAFLNRQRSCLLRAERQLCNQATDQIVVAISDYVAEQFVRHYGIDKKRLVTINNGINIARTIDPNQHSHIRQTFFPESADPTIFLFAAHNFRLKGLRPLLKALCQAQQHAHGQIRLVVAGKGDVLRYKLLAYRLGISKNVFFAGSVQNLPNLIAVADACAVPTFYDSAGRVVMEAVAQAKPAITTAYDGSADMIIDRKHGRIISDPADTDQLAEAIISLCDSEIRDQMRKAILADNLRQQVSIKRHVSQLVSLYERIVRSRCA